VRALKDRKLAV